MVSWADLIAEFSAFRFAGPAHGKNRHMFRKVGAPEFRKKGEREKKEKIGGSKKKMELCLLVPVSEELTLITLIMKYKRHLR